MDTVRKIVLLKNLTGKLRSESYCKNTSYLSFLPSQAKFRLGSPWKLYSLLLLCKLKIYRKTTKKVRSC